MGEELAKTAAAAVLESLVRYEKGKKALRKEMAKKLRNKAKEERRSAMDEKKSSTQNVVKTILIIVAVIAAVVGIVMIVRRFVLAKKASAKELECEKDEEEDALDPEAEVE